MNASYDSFFSSHLELIYNAVGNVQGWSYLVERLASDLDFKSGLISIDRIDTKPGSTRLAGVKHRLSKNISDEWNQEVISHIHKVDIWTEALNQQPTGKFYTAQALVPEEQYKNTEFGEFTLKNDIGDVAAAVLLMTNDASIRIALHHSIEQGLACSKLPYLNKLLPHMQQAARLHDRLGESEQKNDKLMKIIESLSFLVLVTNSSGKVIYSSKDTTEINQTSALLNFRHDVFSLNGRHSDELSFTLKKAVFAAKQNNFDHELLPIVLRNTQGLPIYEIHVTPYSTIAREFGFRYKQALALVSIEKVGLNERYIDLEQLSSLYQLTPKEAQLAGNLAEGKSLEVISKECRRSIHTLRTHLKSLFRKTDTNSQSSLIALLLADKHSLNNHKQSGPHTL